MKHLLKLGGMTPEEILHILDVADEYKRLHKDGVDPKDLQGKAVALVFAKNSTRTRPPRRGDRPRCAGSPRRRNFRRGGEPHLRGKGRAGGAAGGDIRALQ